MGLLDGTNCQALNTLIKRLINGYIVVYEGPLVGFMVAHYWPYIGPDMATYIGPILRHGAKLAWTKPGILCWPNAASSIGPVLGQHHIIYWVNSG